MGNDSAKIDSSENHNKSTSDAKSSVSSPISNSQSTVPQSSSIPHSNSSSSAAPTSAIGEFEQMWFHVFPSRPSPVTNENGWEIVIGLKISFPYLICQVDFFLGLV